MSDRPARPEWRAAYLDRTLPRRSPRRSRRADGNPATDSTRDALLASRRGAADDTAGSFPISIAAMLHLVPTA